MGVMRSLTAILITMLMLISIFSGCAKESSPDITTIATETTKEESGEATTVLEETTAVPETTVAEISAITNAIAGDIIQFGKYEQDNDKANGKEVIDWRVLAIENGKALLVSEKILDAKPFNIVDKDITWETCTLRKWLNEDYFTNAFSANEQTSIATTTILNKDNLDDNTDGGNDTNDKVFLLSFEEVENYFADDTSRIAQGTALAKSHELLVIEDDSSVENSQWWLRSIGNEQNRASFVYEDGTTCDGSLTFGIFNVSIAGIGVRPAIWVKL